MKKPVLFFAAFAAAFGLNVCAASASTLVYGSGDHTRINPAMDEHGEINILLFNRSDQCVVFVCGNGRVLDVFGAQIDAVCLAVSDDLYCQL